MAAVVGVSLLWSGAGCKKKSPEAPGTPENKEETPSAAGERSPGSSSTGTATPPAKPFPVSKAQPPAEIWKEFSGAKAMEWVVKQVEIGPRPAGSPEAEKTRKLITDAIEPLGWEVERQAFTNETPRGPYKFANLIARFSADGVRPVPRTTQRAIVCSHFDTKRYSTIKFVGGNDGASSTGALIELARVLALDPALAAQIELVFFDGEEALNQFDENDGLYGSKYYARTVSESGRARQFKFGILWDMIGDADLTITLPPDSPPEVTRDLLASADALGLRQHFRYYERSILDDHVPLNQIRIPTVDVIDFDYLYWHTADDTLDKLSPDSLQKIGAVTLYHLKKALSK
jgi:hypothetical protein